MRDFLAGSGCRVLEARNSYDGLFLAAQYGHGIHLLVTEINLLPVSGIKLAENVLRLFPQTQVLCMSACEETRPVRHWMKYLNASFLPKPFSPFDLHEKVHAILGERYEEAPMPVLDIRPGEPGWPIDRGLGRHAAAPPAARRGAIPPIPATRASGCGSFDAGGAWPRGWRAAGSGFGRIGRPVMRSLSGPPGACGETRPVLRRPLVACRR